MTWVAVIGAGYWGKNLVRTFYELGALTAVAEASYQLRSGLATTYPGLTLYEDYRPLLNSDVRAVAIATPAHTHFSVAKDCLMAGKDVFVEKPMTLSSAEAEELVRLARLHGRILMVGHLLLFQPPIRKMKQLLNQGVIGKLHSLQQERMKLGIVRSVENVMWSFGVHDIAALLYLVGSTPSGIQVIGQRVLQSDIEDDVYLHMDFPDKVKAHLHASWLWPENRRRLTVIGSDGMLIYDENAMKVTLHRQGVNSDLSNHDEGIEVVYEGSEKPLTLECSDFLQCVETRAEPLSNGETGVDVIRVLENASKMLMIGKG